MPAITREREQRTLVSRKMYSRCGSVAGLVGGCFGAGLGVGVGFAELSSGVTGVSGGGGAVVVPGLLWLSFDLAVDFLLSK